jgi:hypothetical protein
MVADQNVWELWHRTHCGGASSEGFVDRGTAAEIAALVEREVDAEYEDGVVVSLWVCHPGGWGETEFRAEDWLAGYNAEMKRDAFWVRVEELGIDVKFNHGDEYVSFADGFTEREVTFEAVVEDAFGWGDVVLKTEDLARERFILDVFLSRAARIAKTDTRSMHLAKYRVKTGNNGDFVLRFVEWTGHWTQDGERWSVPCMYEGGELLYSYTAPVHSCTAETK